MVSATDSSTSCGFGVRVAPADEALVRDISTLAEKLGDCVVLGTDSKDVQRTPKQRLGFPRHLKLDVNSFRTILSVKARQNAHNNILEAEAYLL